MKITKTKESFPYKYSCRLIIYVQIYHKFFLILEMFSYRKMVFSDNETRIQESSLPSQPLSDCPNNNALHSNNSYHLNQVSFFQ